MTHTSTSVDKNIQWLKVLYTRRSQEEFCSEVTELLRNANITNAKQWLAVCKMGRDLLPNNRLFSTDLPKALKVFGNAPDKTENTKTDTIIRSQTKLLQIKRMARDSIGRKLLLIKIYIELEDLPKIKPLLTHILASDNEPYKAQARSLLRSIMGNRKRAAEFNRECKNNNTNIDLADPLEEIDALFRISQDKDLLMAKIYLELGDPDKAKAAAQNSTNRSKQVGIYIDNMIEEAIAESQQAKITNNETGQPGAEDNAKRILTAEQIRQLGYNIKDSNKN